MILKNSWLFLPDCPKIGIFNGKRRENPKTAILKVTGR
jgi:hypothetical protein